MTDCNIIQDLLVLYADNCCSDSSKALVEDHLKSCDKCRKALEEMKAATTVNKAKAPSPVPAPRRVSEWKASIIQSVTMFLSFIALVAGVSLEAYTPTGGDNGKWALAIIIPVTAFLLSQVNWYFVRSYRSRGVFSTLTAVIALCIAGAGYLWAFLHYDGFASAILPFLFIGIGATAILCIAAKLLSSKYASMLGKE